MACVLVICEFIFQVNPSTYDFVVQSFPLTGGRLLITRYALTKSTSELGAIVPWIF